MCNVIIRVSSCRCWGKHLKEKVGCRNTLGYLTLSHQQHIAPRGQMSPVLGSDSPTRESSEQLPSNPANTALTSSVVEIPQKYESVMQKYAKVSSTSALPLPTLVYVEACLKVARFLLTVAMNGGWNDKVVALLVQGKLTAEATEDTDEHRAFDPVLLKQSTVSRLSIAEWTMRGAGNHMQDLPAMDQVRRSLKSRKVSTGPTHETINNHLDHRNQLHGVYPIFYWFSQESGLFDERECSCHFASAYTSPYKSHQHQK